jgi:hypothetical protein
MIIRMHLKDDENVLGTINTAGTSATATGVGEGLLEVFMKANEGVPAADVTRQIESFFASWKEEKGYGQAEGPADLNES